jgi:ABC-type transport system substrate-binding protein
MVHHREKNIRGLSASRASIAARTIAIIFILVAAVASGIYLAAVGVLPPQQESQTSSGSGSSPTLTWDSANTPQYLDPSVAYLGYDQDILINTFETLLWYNGTCGSCAIPWLAQNYTVSPDLTTYNFTLRPGIKFADGESLTSAAVYFSLNRLLINDGSSPVSLGTQAAWDMQALLNQSLSYVWGGPHAYNERWVKAVLAQDFVQVTGPLTFTIHVQNPSSAFPYLIAGTWAEIMAPNYVMQHDLVLWNQPDNGYTLPYPTLSGNITMQMYEYFADWAATCQSGATPNGCAWTYLDRPYSGALAGSGPYVLQSFDPSTNIVVLTSSPSYWGGPLHERIVTSYKTIEYQYVPDQTTRELDLFNAAKSGSSVIADIGSANLYDIASRSEWLNNNALVSTTPGVSVYGPLAEWGIEFAAFPLNVTNPFTGQYYKFQPFADRRIRLAFADTVNLTEINRDINNNMGQVAQNLEPPGLPPPGTFNPAIKPAYAFNLRNAQQLLLDAMEHPLTSFRFFNGTVAPPGVFNNTFGCSQLGSNGECSNPVQQSIQLTYSIGDPVGEAVMTEIAGTINNISATYRMGLTVSVVPLSLGELTSAAASGTISMYASATGPDYGWAMNLLTYVFPPNGGLSQPAGWNLTAMENLNNQGNVATSSGNLTGVAKVSDAMDEVANRDVMYLWVDWPETFTVMTSSISGYYYNPSVIDPYFALMQPK